MQLSLDSWGFTNDASVGLMNIDVLLLEKKKKKNSSRTLKGKLLTQPLLQLHLKGKIKIGMPLEQTSSRNLNLNVKLSR